MMSLHVEEWRRLRGISKEEMSERLGIHRNTLTNWENNPGMIPMEKAIQIADILNVSLNDIIFLPSVATKM